MKCSPGVSASFEIRRLANTAGPEGRALIRRVTSDSANVRGPSRMRPRAHFENHRKSSTIQR
jgi:hypothetical protein